MRKLSLCVAFMLAASTLTVSRAPAAPEKQWPGWIEIWPFPDVPDAVPDGNGGVFIGLSCAAESVGTFKYTIRARFEPPPDENGGGYYYLSPELVTNDYKGETLYTQWMEHYNKDHDVAIKTLVNKGMNASVELWLHYFEGGVAKKHLVTWDQMWIPLKK